MFGDFQFRFGNIEDLAPFDVDHVGCVQLRLAMPAHADLMVFDFIRRFALAQSIALVALLAAAVLAGFAAKAFAAWLLGVRFFGKPVARRRFGAVGTVQAEAPAKLGVLLFQGGVFAFQSGELAPQFIDQCMKVSRTIHTSE